MFLVFWLFWAAITTQAEHNLTYTGLKKTFSPFILALGLPGIYHVVQAFYDNQADM